MLNFERTGLGSFSHILQFWKASLGFERKTASEGAGLGGNLKAQENVLFAMKKSFTFVASIMKK